VALLAIHRLLAAMRWPARSRSSHLPAAVVARVMLVRAMLVRVMLARVMPARAAGGRMP
jgi:hypothetical protein